MRAAARLVSWLRALAHRRELALDSAEELRFHTEAHAQDLVAQGVPAAEAHRRAAAEAGQPGNLNERRREALGLRLWDETWADIRYGLRGLARNKGFAVIAVGSLALAIGAATAMFSLVYATILDAFPYPDADRIVTLTMHVPSETGDYDDQPPLSPAQREMLQRAGPFSEVMGTSLVGMAIATDKGPGGITGLIVTPNVNRVMGVPALYGRTIEMSDGNPAAPPVAVLNYHYWQTDYSADPHVIGQHPHFGANYTIVGVMPRWYNAGGSVDVYMTPGHSQRAWSMAVTAKLKPRVNKAQALAAILPLLRQFEKTNPSFYPANGRFDLVTLRESYTNNSKFVRSLPMLVLAVCLLLLVGCVNCCVLLLARGKARQHEFALRAAIGATPVRMLRQLLTEGLCIALLGSVAGVGLAYALARLPLWLAPQMFPVGSQVRINLPMLGFAVACASLTGMLSGLLPALHASRPRVATVLQASNRRSVAGGAHRALRTLAGAQIAFTLVLLTLAGATGMGFANLLRVHLGYSPERILMAQLDSDNQFPWAKRMGIVRGALTALDALPGIEQAAVNSELPATGDQMTAIRVPGASVLNSEKVRWNFISANYFSTLRIPLLAGRVWTQVEQQQGLPLAVVNQAFAQRMGSDRAVLGSLVRLPEIDDLRSDRKSELSPAAHSGMVEIVGIAGNTKNMGLERPAAPEIYLNAGIHPFRAGWLLIRTRAQTEPLRHPVRKALLPFMQDTYVVLVPGTLRDDIESQPYWQQQRLVSVLFGIYAALALTLALVGLYSTAQYIALQRRGELGIRLALGATRGHVRWLVLRGNLLVLACAAGSGVLLSLLARAGVERWMAGSSMNPLIVGAAAGLLVLVSLAACLAPAEHAARINPNEVLRAE